MSKLKFFNYNSEACLKHQSIIELYNGINIDEYIRLSNTLPDHYTAYSDGSMIHIDKNEDYEIYVYDNKQNLCYMELVKAPVNLYLV